MDSGVIVASAVFVVLVAVALWIMLRSPDRVRFRIPWLFSFSGKRISHRDSQVTASDVRSTKGRVSIASEGDLTARRVEAERDIHIEGGVGRTVEALRQEPPRKSRKGKSD